MTFNKANPVIGTDTPDSVRTYLIGDDVIAQTVDGVTDYLLYDGHGSAGLTTGGSTRQLAYWTGSDISITDSFSYDGYGVLLQDEDNFPPTGTQTPGYTPAQATSLLYAGEYFDTDSQHYYNRARWYDPLNGRFNRTDPFFGNLADPQSLHKYLYAHCNPINNIDPGGTMALTVQLNVSMLIGALIFTIAALTVLNPVWEKSAQALAEGFVSVVATAVAAATMSLKDALERLKDQIKRLWEKLKPKRENCIYFHYSYLIHTWKLLSGLLPGSWATRDIYISGWLAKMFLAIPHPNPPNAVYIVWPRRGFGPTYGGIVPGAWGMPGGGTQVYFGFGSGGKGTVIGLVPIPRGQRPF